MNNKFISYPPIRIAAVSIILLLAGMTDVMVTVRETATENMDSDEDELSFMSSRNSNTRQSAVKKTWRRGDAGLLGELHSPKHSLDFEEPKRKAFLARDGEDVIPFMNKESRASGQSSMSVRPMTAMSLAGDMGAAIPDLEDLREVGDPPEAVKAPFMAMNNLYSYQELEKDLMKNAAFTSFDDLDFSPLFSRLLPESEVVLEDENWTWDKLVASVSSSLPSKTTG